MNGLVDRALEVLTDEPEMAALLGSGRSGMLVETVRWKAFEVALDLELPELAAHILASEDDALLRSFGRTWASFGPVHCSTDSLQACLADLTGTSERTLYELGTDGSFVVHHWSDRAELVPMAAGVMEGLAVRLGTAVEVSSEVDGDHTRFEVRELAVGASGADVADR